MAERRCPWVALAATVLLVACGSISSSEPAATGGKPVSPALQHRIALALDTIRAPAGAVAAIDVVRNREDARATAVCMAAQGYEYHDTGEIVVPPSSLVRPGVGARWWEPPDARLAAERGFGPGFERQAFDTAVGFEPVDVATPTPNQMYLDSLGPDELVGYDQAFARCIRPDREARELQLAERLGAGAEMVALAAMATPGFETIRREYADCVARHGFSFDDPRDVRTLEEHLSDDEVIAFDRTAAVADASCRGPLYSRFLGLAADEWAMWLDASADELATLDAMWQAALGESGLVDDVEALDSSL